MAVVQDIERDYVEPSVLQKSKDGSIIYSSSSSSSTDSGSERSPLLSSQHSVTLPNYGSRRDSQTDSIPIESPSTGVFAIIGLLLIGTFISNADSTVVLATYGTISSEFNALQIGGWLTTSFTLASTAVQPSVGKLSDIYGRKPVLLISYALFGLGTVMIGIAQSMWQVILGRIISGFGGAGMTVIVSILITDLVPMIQVASWRSYVNVVSTLGRSIGGPLGGVLADTVGWRWSFIGQGPIILLAIILVTLKLPSTTGPNTNTNTNINNTDSDLSSLNTQIKGQPSKLRRIDFIGAFLLATTLITFLGALSIGGQQVPWSHPIILLLLGTSVILCILFLTYEANWAIEPVLPPSLLTKYDVAECYARTTLQVAAQLSMMFSVPLYFKVTQNASNTTAGAHLFPAVLGNTLGGLLAGYTIQKTGRYKSLTVIAHAVSAIGYLLLVLRWKGNTSWLQSLDIIPGGLGTGLNGAATFIALTSSIERKDIAVATGGMFLFASIGTISGIAISSAIQQTSLKHLLEEGLRDVGRNVGTGPGRKGRLRIIRDVIRDVENVQKLEGKVKEVVIQAYVKSLEYSHVFSLVCAVVALGLAVVSREYRLK